MYRAIVLMPPEWLAKHTTIASRRPACHNVLITRDWRRPRGAEVNFQIIARRHSQACLASIMNGSAASRQCAGQLR